MRKGIPRLILGTVLAGLVLSSCEVPEPKAEIPIEFLEPGVTGVEFQNWIFELIQESCDCRARVENDLLVVPRSKKDQVMKVLRTWSGENVGGVNFHAGYPDRELPLPPDRILVPFRHDPERKGVVGRNSIMGDSRLGMKEVYPQKASFGWVVVVQFDDETSSVIGKYTEAHVGDQMAILLNGKILSMPVIAEPFSSGATITGDFTVTEARGIAMGIRNPPPLGFRIRPE